MRDHVNIVVTINMRRAARDALLGTPFFLAWFVTAYPSFPAWVLAAYRDLCAAITRRWPE